MTAAVARLPPAAPSRPRRVGGKFLLAVGLVLPAVLGVAAVGALGTARLHQQVTSIETDNMRTTHLVADLVDGLQHVEAAALLLTATYAASDVTELNAELEEQLLPELHSDFATLETVYADEPSALARLNRIRAGFQRYLALRRSGAYDAVGTVAARTTAALARETADLFHPINELAHQLRADEEQQATAAEEAADRIFRTGLVELLATLLVCVLLGAGAVIWLIRDMVPRIREYSRYASDVAADQAEYDLNVRGQDELSALGHALNVMVSERRQVQRQEQGQAEFVEALQVTEDEDEADNLLKRHLERSLPGATAVVLKRNNSADRLQASTPVPPEADLSSRLSGAQPRACLAVRYARCHQEGSGRVPLRSCSVCGDRDVASTCEPLLVGGEVIGSVLVSHPESPTHRARQLVQQSVTQAAPVLANQRNLALAEFRANNDSLTGLPNKRATEDTLKRMVAQANRSLTPLTAVMLDLDRFKQVNDRFGHAQGDEVLAAAGAAIRSSLRSSDFAGRFGGEEFLILLPETSLDGARLVAEKIRETISSVTVPGVDRDITASLGVSDLLEHGGTTAGLLRAADRALYDAKTAGRNRTVVAASAEQPSAPVEPELRADARRLSPAAAGVGDEDVSSTGRLRVPSEA